MDFFSGFNHLSVFFAVSEPAFPKHLIKFHIH